MARHSRIARILFAATAAGFSLPATTDAVTFTWNGSASTLWDDFNNWTPLGVPGSGDIALLTTISPSPGTIDIRGPRLVRSIVASGATGTHTFVNSGSGALTFFAGVGTTSAENAIRPGGPVNGPTVFDCDVDLLSNTAPVMFSAESGRILVNGNVSTAAASGVSNLVLTGFTAAGPQAVRVDGVISDGPNAQMSLTAGLATSGSHRAEVVVAAPNTYTGPTSVNGATLIFNSIFDVGGGPSALGAPTTVSDATIDLGSAVDGDIAGTLRYVGIGHSSNRPFRFSGFSPGGAIESSGAGPLILSGGLTSTSSSQINRNLSLAGTNFGQNIFSGVIEDVPGTARQSVSKDGPGRWIVTAANTYDGTTIVNGGTLVLDGAGAAIGGGGGATGALTINGGTFILNGGTVEASDLNNAGGAFVFNSGSLELSSSNTITGAGSFTIGATGPGSLRLTGGSQNFGDIVLQGSDDSLVINAGGTYAFDSLDNSAGGIVGAVETVNIQMNGGQLTTTHGEIRARLQGSGGLTKVGSGSLGISQSTNPNTYTGPTNINGGMLAPISLVTANQIPDTSPVTIAAGAVLDLRQSTDGERVGPLSGSGSVLTDQFEGLDVNTNGTTATFAGAISGAGSFTKSGTGKQTLAGQSNYTGATSVVGGTLDIGAGGAITGTSSVIYSLSSTLAVTGGTIDTPGSVRPIANSAVLNLTDGLIKANQIDRTVNTQYLSAFNWTGGTVHLLSATRIAGGATRADQPFADSLTLSPAKTLIVDDTLSVLASGSLNLSGGTVVADDIVTGGVINFSSGVMRMRNDQTLDAARLSALDLDQLLDVSKTLIVDGAATVNAPLTVAGGSIALGSLVHPNNLILSSGSLEITAGALDVTAGTSVDAFSGMHITAAGGLQVASTGQFNTIGTTFTGAAASVNDGQVNAINSALNFGGGLTNNGALNLINTSVSGSVQTSGVIEIAGTGTFTGAVSGNGDFAGAGTTRFEGSYRPGGGAAAQINFSGNLALAPSNTLLIDLAGTVPGALHDQILVAGEANLDGSLDINLINGFLPTAGDVFTILGASSVNGRFGTITGREIDPTTWLATIYQPGAVRLAVAAGGDANLDGLVNLADFNILAANFGASGVNWLMADFTGDGRVNLADFNVLASQFGHSAAGADVSPDDWSRLAASVPDPAGASVGFALAAGALVRRRRAISNPEHRTLNP